MASKWQNLASISKKRISLQGNSNGNAYGFMESSVASKGYFVVYSSDQKRLIFKKGLAKELEKALLNSVVTSCQSPYGYFYSGHISNSYFVDNLYSEM
ncbi:conserved hypothetical protein [Ricinus communis]|uniref:Uncharacterized protein n=1 Tax=Ricinus communis TaxID=3988 RepID=B9S9J2_RICCO|nr:conserved hypothetical protein [Ricinus communis]